MANIRLEALKTRLQQYLDCEAAVLTGAQSYAIGSRNLTRANLREISGMIKYLELEIAKEESAAAGRGRNACVGAIPRDL